MNCTEVEKSNYTERYLVGELDEAEVRELEEHYFSCVNCSEALKDAAALSQELADDRWAVVARPAPALLRRKWTWAVAAAVVVMGVGVPLWFQIQERSATVPPEIARLATIEAPAYSPSRLRGPGDEGDRLFLDAMVLYRAGDYTAAIPVLEEAAQTDPESAKILFYLGACYLLTGRTETGVERLRAVTELGDTVYLEEARFYLALAHLRESRLESALDELGRVVELQGDLEGRASELVQEIRRIDELPE